MTTTVELSLFSFHVPGFFPVMNWMSHSHHTHTKKSLFWSPDLQCDGIWKPLGLRLSVEPPWWDYCPYKKRKSLEPEKVVICKPGRELSADPKHSSTLISDDQPPELWVLNFCCLSQALEFCFGSPTKLRHSLNFTPVSHLCLHHLHSPALRTAICCCWNNNGFKSQISIGTAEVPSSSWVQMS